MTNNMKILSDMQLKILKRVPDICFIISILIAISLNFFIKDKYMQSVSTVIIVLMFGFFFLSNALIGHFSGEFNIRGAKATRNESPGGFYFGMSLYIFLAIVFFLIFIKLLLK